MIGVVILKIIGFLKLFLWSDKALSDSASLRAPAAISGFLCLDQDTDK